MAKHADIISNFDDYKKVLEFRKDFKTNVIENGLDAILEQSLLKLKEDLKFLINEQVRVTPEDQKVQDDKLEENPLGQAFINPPKSEDEILKFLTDGKVDLSKYNKSKDYSTLQETGVVFGHHSSGQRAANRIELRLEIQPDETVEEQYQKAKEFFEKAIFALPDGSGKTNYFINPGLDITPFLKIKCSVFTGTGDTDGEKGMSPARRFQRDTHRRGFAQWTFKQDAVEEIRKKYINITEVVNLIKDGDYESANKILKRNITKKGVSNKEVIYDMSSNVDKLKENSKNLPTSTQSYINILNMINNLETEKKIIDGTTRYSLVTTYEDFDDSATNILAKLEAEIRRWTTINENYWFLELVKRTENLIKLYTSQSTTSFRD